VPPTLAAAARLGLAALRRAAWLVAPGLLVALARRALAWPAIVVAWALALRGALSAVEASPLDPLAPARGAVSAWASPGVLAILGGLWLTGIACGAVLRVAYVAGALPTLAGAAAGDGGAPRFAAGVAFGTPRVLATALLGLVADVSAAGFAVVLAVASLRITEAALGGSGPPLVAGAVAAALVLAVLVPLAIGVVGDAAVARAGVLAEGPARAFAGATRRFLLRPGAFLLAAILFGLLAAIVPASVEALASGPVAALVARGAPLLALGPELMLATGALVVAAAIDLWRLGTVAALGCAWDRVR
jgi:hypothetical protein